MKNTAPGLVQRLMISKKDNQRDAALRRVVTHGEIHQKLGSRSEAVKHPLQTWNVGPDVRARRQRHNERQIKHEKDSPETR